MLNMHITNEECYNAAILNSDNTSLFGTNVTYTPVSNGVRAEGMNMYIFKD